MLQTRTKMDDSSLKNSNKAGLRVFLTRWHNLAVMGVVTFTVLFALVSWLHLGPETPFKAIFINFAIYSTAHFLLYFFAVKGYVGGTKRDLTPILMVMVVTYMLSMHSLADGFQHILLIGYANVMTFGFFKLSARSQFAIAAYISIGYAVVSWSLAYKNMASINYLDFAVPVLLSISLLGSAVVGKEVSRFRAAYMEQNKELQRVLQQVEEMAITDELTGLFNRRYLLQAVEKQRAIALRENKSFVIAFVDLDHFKQVNDSYGHLIGDETLKEVAFTLKSCVREVDLVARYGGEEFILLLTGVDLDKAEYVLERIRSLIEEQRYSSRELSQTVSIGATQYMPDEEPMQLLNRADRLLYQAKQSGRNRIELGYL